MALGAREIPRLRLALSLRERKARDSASPLGMTMPVRLIRGGALLQALRSGIVAEQIFENGQDVLAVLNDAFQNRTKFGSLGPRRSHSGEHRGGDANIPAEFVGGVAAQEKAAENALRAAGTGSPAEPRRAGWA